MQVHAQLSRGPPPCRRLPIVSGLHARTRGRVRALGGEDAAALFQNMINLQVQQFIRERETAAGLVVKVDVLRENVKEVKEDVKVARADVKEDLRKMKQDLKEEIKGLKEDMKDIKQDLKLLVVAMARLQANNVR